MRSGAGSARCKEIFGRRLAGVIVQPVVTGGVEVVISVLRERWPARWCCSGSAAPTAMCWLTAPPGSLPSPNPTPTT